MASEPLRVVCYVNQFFGQLGGEDKAGVGPQVRDGAVGAARAVQQALGEAGTVVATVICGDNYAAEQADRAVAEILALVAAARPDLVIAGPAFLAGRYGVACGALCAAVQTKLGIPAVTGMQAENPGVELYRRQVYVVQTGAEATRMLAEVRQLVALGLKLARGEAIGTPAAEGYFARGVTRNVVTGASAADRATAMLLDKLAGRPFASEVPRPAFPSVPAPRLVKTLEGATIALVTDGGLVPRGNPDGIEALNATRYGAYSIEGKRGLDAAQYDNPHRGYDTSWVKQDPHRLVPVDVARELEQSGAIGKLHETVYSTVGVATTLAHSARMGREIADKLRAAGVDAVILTST
ncbi:MAG TPA: glycine/betaine/sarcosine/D-proline family reductase selenoprotein B [Methylomirabilota bacterium]